MVAVLAVDWGATSVRVCRVELSAEAPPVLEIVHRHHHGPVRHADGSLRWDFDGLMAETLAGLRAGLSCGPVASIGVDTWGVDYGLLDAEGELISAPYSYRDERTAGYESVVDHIGAERLYGISGLQLLPFTTIFQLAVHDPAELTQAAHVVLLPDLVAHRLADGALTAELTIAGTTGLLDLSSRSWSAELLEAIGLDETLLPPVTEPGVVLGHFDGVPVRLVGGHDTASAVAAGAADGAAFVSAGTWLLVGIERDDPDRSPTAQGRNMTNELGVDGRIRFLRNVAGWWLIEECRRQWGDVELDGLLAAAAALTAEPPVFDATDDRFLAPDDMVREITDAAGLPAGADRATIVRSAVESMAQSAAELVDWLDAPAVRVFGGGSRADLFVDALVRRAERTVSVGPVETTALGNAMMQGIGLGLYDDLREARAVLTA